MDKKYNGFNNGRDKSDGVGGREVNHGTQETMTKEQILEKHFGSEFYRLKEEGFDTHIYSAMSEWESQQLSAERERAGKLVEAIELVISLGYVSDILTKPLNEYKQTINDYDTATKES